jgi:hypothetical protein
MIAQNKNIFIGMAMCVVMFAMTHLFMIQPNWVLMKTHLSATDENRLKWEKLYKVDGKLLPLPEAEKAIKESNAVMLNKLDELKKIEFGTEESLRSYSIKAAGSAGDYKNYFDAEKTRLRLRAKDAVVELPPELGIDATASDDPVPLNLFRLAMVDRLLVVCKDSGVNQVTRLSHGMPSRIASKEPVSESADDERDPKNGKNKTEKAVTATEADVLVRFPMRVVLSAPERVFAQFLYDVQRPRDSTHGYFCIRGFHVYVRDANTGMVEASILFQGLLNQKTATKLGITLEKEVEGRRRPSEQKEVDLDRY